MQKCQGLAVASNAGTTFANQKIDCELVLAVPLPRPMTEASVKGRNNSVMKTEKL
jgi:hypothetical protein